MTYPLTATVTTRKVAATARTTGGWVFTVTLSNGTTVTRRANRQYAALAFDPETNGKGCCTTGSADARRLLAQAFPSAVVVDLATGAVLKQPGTDLRPVREAAAPRAKAGNTKAWEKFQTAPARLAKEMARNIKVWGTDHPTAADWQAMADAALAVTPEQLEAFYAQGARSAWDLNSKLNRLHGLDA